MGKGRNSLYTFLPGLRPSSLIKSGLQAQNLCENFVISVSRYSPRSSGAWMWRKNSLSALGKNWFLKLCSVTRSSKTSLLVEKEKGTVLVNFSLLKKWWEKSDYSFFGWKYFVDYHISNPIKYMCLKILKHQSMIIYKIKQFKNLHE